MGEDIVVLETMYEGWGSSYLVRTARCEPRNCDFCAPNLLQLALLNTTDIDL